MRNFWDSEANKFTLYGAIFGILFPIIATAIEAVQLGGLTIANAITVQQSDPLLWIIDSAPFFLGLFARFAGWRQDQLKKIIREHESISDEVKETFEDSSQFAGVLTFLAAGLVGVVLFLVILWLQSLITSRIETIADATPANTTAAIAESNAPAVVTLPPPTAVVIVAEPTSAEPTSAEPIVLPTLTSTPAPVVSAAPAATEDLLGVVTQALDVVEAPSEEAPGPADEPGPSTPAVTALRLGYLTDGRDACRFATEVTAGVWQAALPMPVTLEAFESPDELFAALTELEHPRHINFTLCYEDPTDREFLRQYAGGIEIVGRTYWTTNNTRLLAVRSRDAATLPAETARCIDAYLDAQIYNEAVDGGDAASWLAANQADARAWMGC